MITILSMLLALQAAPAPKLSDIAALSPRAAGDLLLRGETHAPIVAVEPRPQVGLMLPGESELALVEQPVATPQGCVRGRWIIVFQPDRASGDPSPRVDRMRKTTEIARSTRRGCAGAVYVGLANGLSTSDGFDALARLERVRDLRAELVFDCSDAAETGLCASDRSIRRAVATLSAWLIMRSGGEDRFWLGRPGGIVTEIRIDRARPQRIGVSRRIPAPA